MAANAQPPSDDVALELCVNDLVEIFESLEQPAARRPVDTRRVTIRATHTSSKRGRAGRTPLPLPPRRPRIAAKPLGASTKTRATPTAAAPWAPFGVEGHLLAVARAGQTVVSPVLAEPTPFWEAPAAGDTVVGPTPIL